MVNRQKEGDGRDVFVYIVLKSLRSSLLSCSRLFSSSAWMEASIAGHSSRTFANSDSRRTDWRRTSSCGKMAKWKNGKMAKSWEGRKKGKRHEIMINESDVAVDVILHL